MPIDSSFTITLEDPVDYDITFVFEIKLERTDGTFIVEQSTAVMPKGNSSLDVSITINEDFDKLKKQSGTIRLVSTTPPLPNFDFDLLPIDFVASLPPPPPPRTGGGGSGGRPGPTPTGTPPGKYPLLEKAVTDQAQYVYANFGQSVGRCAGWTAMIAKGLKKHIDAASPTAIPITGGGWGDANDDVSWKSNTTSNGLYDTIYLGELDYYTMVSTINSQPWNWGDVCQYFSTKLTATGAPVSTTKFRHCQIYTGNLYSAGGWSTDKPNNWTVSVVYGGSSSPDAVNYTFKVYRYAVKSAYLK